jgi:hypothetical protein
MEHDARRWNVRTSLARAELERGEHEMKRKLTASQSDRRDDEVGYGMPPKATRFKPGVSGNPKGRPKWKDDGLMTRLLGAEIFRPVRIQQNGMTTSMPALQIAVRRLMMSAAKGDAAAVMAMMKLAQLQEQTLVEQKRKAPSLTNQERIERLTQIFETAKLRMQKKDAAKLAKSNDGKKAAS